MEALPPFTRRSFGALRSQAEPGNERKGRLLSRSERRRFIDLEWRLCLPSRGGASGLCVPRQSLGTREKEGYFRGEKGDDSLTWIESWYKNEGDKKPVQEGGRIDMNYGKNACTK